MRQPKRCRLLASHRVGFEPDTRFVGSAEAIKRLLPPAAVVVVGLFFTALLASWARSSHDYIGENAADEQLLTTITEDLVHEARTKAREVELILLGALPDSSEAQDEPTEMAEHASDDLAKLDAQSLPGVLGFAVVVGAEDEEVEVVAVPLDMLEAGSGSPGGLDLTELGAWVQGHSKELDLSSANPLTVAHVASALSADGSAIIVAASRESTTLIAQFDSDAFLLGVMPADLEVMASVLPSGASPLEVELESASRSAEIVLFSVPWRLSVSLDGSLPAEHRSSRYLVVAALGLVLSLSAGALFLRLSGSRHRFEVEKNAAEDELRSSHERFQVGFDTSPIGVAELDEDGRVVKFNKALGALLGAEEQDLVGTRLSDFVCARSMGEPTLPGAGVPEGRREVSYCLNDGNEVWVQESASVFVGPRGAEHTLIQVVDVTEERKVREELEQRVLHDGLTSLPNRALLGDRIVQALARGRRSGSVTAVIFIDIDHFKVVNDSLGHSSGDILLREVADRLRSNARAADTIARFGGDEFVMLCEDLDRPEDALGLAERLRRTMERPIDVGERAIPITLSLGIAVANAHDNPEALLRDADLAMYQAKEDGRDRVVMFEREMRNSLVDRLAMEDQLRLAIETGDLRLHYQPILDLDANAITGFESLVRWLHPMRGLLPPSEFLDIAEQLDLLTDIDAWTLTEATGQLASWLRRREVPQTTVVGVNASALNFVNASYPSLVRATLSKTGLDPKHLVIELTEDAVLANTERAANIISELRQIGVRVAIDDFGTGYSSFSQLASLNFDILKVDRSFTQHMHEKSGGEIVSALIQMSKALGLVTVVEGVESDQDLELLQEFGSDLAQGYVIAKPMPPREVPQIMKEYWPQGAEDAHR